LRTAGEFGSTGRLVRNRSRAWTSSRARREDPACDAPPRARAAAADWLTVTWDHSRQSWGRRKKASMVRKGSSVRVRQRASGPLQVKSGLWRPPAVRLAQRGRNSRTRPARLDDRPPPYFEVAANRHWQRRRPNAHRSSQHEVHVFEMGTGGCRAMLVCREFSVHPGAVGKSPGMSRPMRLQLRCRETVGRARPVPSDIAVASCDWVAALPRGPP
jgi:hypothetical protein